MDSYRNKLRSMLMENPGISIDALTEDLLTKAVSEIATQTGHDKAALTRPKLERGLREYIAKSSDNRVRIELCDTWVKEKGDLTDGFVFNLLSEVVSSLLPLFDKHTSATVQVQRGRHPKVFYPETLNDPYTIVLSAQPGYWAQLAFQAGACMARIFAYGRNGEPPGPLAERIECAISLHNMKRLADRWESPTAVPKWLNEYSSAMFEYVVNATAADHELSKTVELVHKEHAKVFERVVL